MKTFLSRPFGTKFFGSVAVFLFLVQAFTGVLLAFTYAPTPGEAYNSLKYIITELTGGSLIRGLHHWGASLMIVVVVLHMTQVFVWGAYKNRAKPRYLPFCEWCWYVRWAAPTWSVTTTVPGMGRSANPKPMKHKADSVMPGYDLPPER